MTLAVDIVCYYTSLHCQTTLSMLLIVRRLIAALGHQQKQEELASDGRQSVIQSIYVLMQRLQKCFGG